MLIESNAKLKYCTCDKSKAKHIYIERVDTDHYAVEWLDKMYCQTCNSYWYDI